MRIYIQVSIWTALLAIPGVISGGITLSDMISYVIAAFLLRTLTRSNVSYKLADRVRSGSVAVDMIRPTPLISYMFFEQLSENLFSLLISGTPVIILSAVFFGIKVPTFINLSLFLTSVVLAVILMFYIEYVFGLGVFWLKNGTHTDFIVSGMFTVFSGMTIPLWFYPEALARVCDVLPFKLVAFEPISIFLGRYDLSQALGVILLQLLWLGIFVLLERLVWHTVQRYMFIQGG